MTDLQLYLLIAPLIVAGLGSAAAWWWVRH